MLVSIVGRNAHKGAPELWIGPRLVLSGGLRILDFDEAAAHATMTQRE